MTTSKWSKPQVTKEYLVDGCYTMVQSQKGCVTVTYTAPNSLQNSVLTGKAHCHIMMSSPTCTSPSIVVSKMLNGNRIMNIILTFIKITVIIAKMPFLDCNTQNRLGGRAKA